MIRAVFPTPIRSYATIALSAYRSVQGPVLREYRDGRVMIDTGHGPMTGQPLNRPPRAPSWMPILGLGY
ncbi:MULTISPECIES: hypothetical protein [Paracoccus]|uniref:hypothetical protein n=1 Tax=Paracoccus TaxID=265 RepID=UPI00036767EF|nr:MULTISPECIES: hypothetical protein [Paracoccus]MCV2447527.1 hypothetical protein [Paracoccus sp. DMF]MDQ7776966.1 hypothetical protein [Paracoccus aminovorans]